ncbi:hypothetical protein AMK59_1425 [Oryctes borbonicus]|uniref:BED-type domain-containing protein n=1 Tax=Oryctes borbonicus TaxID=1629725 RepID=A0A0T6B9J4_9SCAR|nr:hypothetical protein AMK59_1425 [Oryctes borbonicus]
MDTKSMILDIDIKSEDPYYNSSDDDPEYCPVKTKRKPTVLDHCLCSNRNDSLENETNLSLSCTSSSFNSQCKLTILNGKFFKVISNKNNHIIAECQICLPKKKFIQGTTKATSNFIKHLRRIHSDIVTEYNEDNKLKKENEISKKRKTVQTAHSSIETRVVSQQEFDARILKFVINTMSPLSVLEDKSFLDIFQGMDLKVIGRKCSAKKIELLYVEHVENLKKDIQIQKYICTTSDIWSARRRSFIGVTCHWIDGDFKRKSYALSCQRFKGRCDYRRIAEVLQTVHTKFELDDEKVIATIGNNGFNFVKSFKIFGNIEETVRDKIVSNYSDTSEDDESSTEYDFVAEPKEFGDKGEEYVLPRHKQCASYILNLIATSDCKKAIQQSAKLCFKSTQAFIKCDSLWKKGAKPEISDVVTSCLGHTISTLGITKWNFLYNNVKQILVEKEKMPSLFQKLHLKYFTDGELLYLEEYCQVLEPIAITLNILQGQENTFYGILLPILFSLKTKLEKMQNLKDFKNGGEILLPTCLNSLKRRFQSIFQLKDEDAIIAAMCFPKFKLRWFNVVDENLCVTKDDLRRKLIVASKEFYNDNAIKNESLPEISEDYDGFFDFNEIAVHQSSTSGVSSSDASNQSKIELEVLHFLNDKRQNVAMLNDFPLIKKVFLKYNTCLSSSAPVERLFSFATIINAPRRHALSDANFERLVVLKANNL